MTKHDNTIKGLRDVLFETLRGLNDRENQMDIKQAHAVAEVSQVIINTAKVEIQYARETNSAVKTGFLPEVEQTKPALPTNLPPSSQSHIAKTENGYVRVMGK